MEARVTKEIIYTRGDFLKTPRVPPSSLLGLCVCLEARVTKEIIYTRREFLKNSKGSSLFSFGSLCMSRG
jgi:hypothetical protein